MSRITLWSLLLTNLPAVAAHAAEAELPNGVCGGPQVMATAAQSGRAMVQQVIQAGTPWGDNRLN
jgi:hypothetical protein